MQPQVQAVSVEDYAHIHVTPITGSIGAEVSGVDLRELDDSIIAELRHAWLAHKVLFFRDQALTRAEHVAYGRALGKLEIHPFAAHAEDHPEIIVIDSNPEKFYAAQTWHTDVTFRECPPLGSILMGRVIPQWGGDTCWANMELAYDLLDDATKERIQDLYAVHSMEKTFGSDMTDEERAKALEAYPRQRHPIVRTHPETGAKSLFINNSFALYIDDMEPEEGVALQDRLCDMAKLPEVQCRFRWRENSIAQWDNRCTQHYAVPDHAGTHRRVERVTLIGDRPH